MDLAKRFNPFHRLEQLSRSFLLFPCTLSQTQPHARARCSDSVTIIRLLVLVVKIGTPTIRAKAASNATASYREVSVLFSFPQLVL
jgi:hypothetical protein